MTTASAETQSAKRVSTRFSLRALLLAIFVLSVLLGTAANQFRQVSRRRAVVREIEDRGGVVTYFMLTPIGPDEEEIEEWGTEPPGPAMLRGILGDHFFADGVEVEFTATPITTFTCSEDGQSGSISTEAIRFTDRDLEWLELLPRLDMINLDESSITENGAARLERAFPNVVFVD